MKVTVKCSEGNKLSTDWKQAVSKVRAMGSGFNVKIFTKKLLAVGPFGPWGDFSEYESLSC
jgi:hypothetical protein